MLSKSATFTHQVLKRNKNVAVRCLSTTLDVGSSESLVVVGSGVAGCATALRAANEYNIQVNLICAGSELIDCNSYWAQGGIIYRNYDPVAKDSSKALISDILKAGDGADAGLRLCDLDAVTKVSEEGPERVRQFLLDESDEKYYANVPFDRDQKSGLLSYCLEASHSAPRILYWADKTGKAISTHMAEAVLRNPKINIVNSRLVTDLIVQDGQAIGVQTINTNTDQRSNIYSDLGVVLASGGLGGIYSHSTNPKGFNALGSSTAIARRSGAKLSDLEYVQFHPTALNMAGKKPFLLTEALRGCGAFLVDEEGRRFMPDFHDDAELAPRDVVARAVYATSQAGSEVYLDITHKGAEFVRNRFPTIHQYLSENTGLDIGTQRIPITPAAHYTCGGIATDLNAETNITGLFAAGESARSGLHGGNRLASTSLLEGLVFGASAAEYIGEQFSGNNGKVSKSSRPYEEVLKDTNKDILTDKVKTEMEEEAQKILTQVRRVMWNQVGIARTSNGLYDAKHSLKSLNSMAEELFNSGLQTPAIVAARDASLSGLCVAESAAANSVSAGAHYMADIVEINDVEAVAM